MGDPIVTKINVQDIPYKIKGTLYDERGYNTDGGMTQSAITNLFDGIDLTLSKNESKMNSFTLTTEDGFYIIDANGYISLVVNSNGVFDVLDIGSNIRSIIGEITNTSISTALETVNASLETVNASIEELNNDLTEIEEKLPETSNTIETEEDGVYFVDENGWVGCQYVNGVWSFSNLSNDNGSSSTISTDYSLIVRANDTLKQARELNDKVDSIIPSLLTLTDGSQQTVITKNIINTTSKKKAIVRLRLHHGSSKYGIDTQKFSKYAFEDTDIFFNGSCKTDFSDVRFFDNSGNMLKASFGKLFNLGVYRDTSIYQGNIYYFTTSQGYLIIGSSGIRVSKDNGATWIRIAGTEPDPTNRPQAEVSGSTYISPVYVGKNSNNMDVIFGHAAGHLWKIETDFETTVINPTSGKEELSATITDVLNFSWVYDGETIPNVVNNGDTIYPDLRGNAVDVDRNGNMYIGLYQRTTFYHVQVFVSTDGGNTWSSKYLYYNQSEKRQQHVHHINADKYSNKVYVGIDGGYPRQGPTVIVTEDAGETWTDISTVFQEQRSHDYYPSYFGTDYKLGGGESYTLGGNTLIRGDETDTKFDVVFKGYGGIRTLADFGNDNMIIAGVSRDSKHMENQIVCSFDKGKTWQMLSRTDVDSDTSSGDGYRNATYCGTIAGDNAPCIILSGGDFVAPVRIYNGGDYYREVEIEVDNVSSSNISIIAKTGYLMPYPYSTVRGIEDESLVYEVPFNEGCGNLIQDSNGNIVSVNGTIEWETEEEPVRYGEYSTDSDKPFKFSSAAKISGGVNFGKIPNLDFASGYTITFWFNEKARMSKYAENEEYGSINDGIAHEIASIGAYKIVRYNEAIALMDRTTGYANRSSTGANGHMMQCSDNYYFVALVIKTNIFEFYINGNPGAVLSYSSWSDWASTNISSQDLIIGSGDIESCGYISDFKIYHKEMTSNEVRDIYKGFNYQNKKEN